MYDYRPLNGVLNSDQCERVHFWVSCICILQLCPTCVLNNGALGLLWILFVWTNNEVGFLHFDWVFFVLWTMWLWFSVFVCVFLWTVRLWFLRFVCVFCGQCGFSTLRLRLLWAVWLWFFYTSFTSSVDSVIVVFLRFVYNISDLDSVIVVFLRFVCVWFGQCDCGFSDLRLRLIWRVWLWFFCTPFVSSAGRAIVVLLQFVCAFSGTCDCGFLCIRFVCAVCGHCDCGFSTLRLCLVWLQFIYVFYGPCDCGFSAFCLCLIWTGGLWYYLQFTSFQRSLQLLLRIVPYFILEILGDNHVTSKICLYRSYVSQLHHRYGLVVFIVN